MDRRLLTRPAIAFGALVLTAVLAGCATQGPVGPGVTPSPTPTSAPSPSEPPVPEPTPTPTDVVAAAPIGIGCDGLLSLQGVYDLNPNLSIVPDDAPPAGSLAATLVSGLGVACDLVHNSNGEVLLVAAATPGSEAIAALRASATEPVDIGIAGVDAVASAGAIIAIDGNLVVTAESSGYFGSEDLAEALRIAFSGIG